MRSCHDSTVSTPRQYYAESRGDTQALVCRGRSRDVRTLLPSCLCQDFRSALLSHEVTYHHFSTFQGNMSKQSVIAESRGRQSCHLPANLSRLFVELAISSIILTITSRLTFLSEYKHSSSQQSHPTANINHQLCISRPPSQSLGHAASPASLDVFLSYL